MKRHPMAAYRRPPSELRAADHTLGRGERDPTISGLGLGVALSLPLWAVIIQAIRGIIG